MDNKSKSGKTGYEIIIEIPGEGAKIYCIDNTGKIRGRCMQKYRHYMSNWELWKDHKGLGEIIGDFKKEKLVFIIENEKNTQAKALKIKEVNIAEMTSDPYIWLGFINQFLNQAH